MSARDDVLNEYADRIRAWAVSQVVKLWSQVDAEDIRGSFTPILPALIDVHKALVTQALVAVDGYMLGKASEAGFQYDVTWKIDRPQRVNQVYYGADAAQYISRAPIVVLERIKAGHDVQTAMMFGLNYLLRSFGTEAHEIIRNVPLQRVLAQ